MKKPRIEDLTVAQKRTIIYLSLSKNIPLHKISNSLKIDKITISDYISFLLSDEQEQDKFLPEEMYDRKNKRYKNVFPKGSYYSHLKGVDQEMMIASDWMPVYEKDGIDTEYINIFNDVLSFSEKLKLVTNGNISCRS